MDYEQKYKEALGRAKGELKVCGSQDCDAARQIFRIFPELKDSEDERIRKGLIKAVSRIFEGNKLFDTDVTREEALAWLEKQGEQSSDKIETKFKVGDWISGYYTNYKVTAIHSKGYMVEDTDGTKINIPFENEKFHHLWTIQDAKDGDILSGEIDGEVFVFLFNQIQDRWIVAHVYYSETEGEFIEKAYLHRYHSFSPATKEQHNLLFQKMKEAGYDWDSEKKKLKKVESKTSLL